jgi:hypothetical protein
MVARLDQQALDATLDHVLVAVDVRRHDRHPGGHRLEEDDPEALLPGGRGAEDVGAGEVARLGFIGDAAKELDVADLAQPDEAPVFALLRP